MDFGAGDLCAVLGDVGLPGDAVRRQDGAEKIPGQAESAPANFKPRRIVTITTIVATLLFGLYYANYVKGWITADTLNFAPYRG